MSGALALAGCAAVPASSGPVASRSETCIASIFDEGSRLADGSRWSRSRSRAEVLVAHRAAPLGSSLRITRLDTGASIVAPVKDRGPFVRGRCIDLSVAAARALGVDGVVRVRVNQITVK